MPVQRNDLEFNNFVKGIITEAGPLTYPENASLDEQNFVLNRDGSRQRRLGLDYEDGYEILDPAVSGDVAITSFSWIAPSGIKASFAPPEVAVLQVGANLYFFDQTATSVSASQVGSATLVGVDPTFPFSYANVLGRLVIAAGTDRIYSFSWGQNIFLQPVPSLAILPLSVRDVWGVLDTFTVSQRPAITSTQKHNYNLENQGWPERFLCFDDIDGNTSSAQDPIDSSLLREGIAPSNADIIWQNLAPSAGSIGSIGAFSAFRLDASVPGTTPAPKGSKVLVDVFDRGQGRVDASDRLFTVAQLGADTTSGGIIAVAGYAGRAFYAINDQGVTDGDLNSPDLSSVIFYSQTATSASALNKCYAENDPTAEILNQPLATDGGFISIPEMGRVLDMATLGNSLFVFASNGVWEIHGGEDSFTATNQSVSKTTNAGCIGKGSIVQGDEVIGYWSPGGIYAITVDSVSLRGVATNLTQITIQTLYNDIPGVGKALSAGVYDVVSRQVRWLYRDSVLEKSYIYNRELIYDLNLEAFYVNAIEPVEGDVRAYPCAYVNLSSIVTAQDPNPVLDGVDNVLDGLEEVTDITRVIAKEVEGSTKYFTAIYDIANNSSEDPTITISQFNEPDFYDWKTLDGTGVDAYAYLVTGYWTGGLSSKDKDVINMTTHFRRTEQGFTQNESGDLEVVSPSGCTLQAQWEWTNSSNAGRWTDPFEAYKLKRLYTPVDDEDDFDYGFIVVSNEHTIRGYGPALSLFFQSQEGKDCHIYGWGVKTKIRQN